MLVFARSTNGESWKSLCSLESLSFVEVHILVDLIYLINEGDSMGGDEIVLVCV